MSKVSCPICKVSVPDHLINHLSEEHSMDLSEFKEKYPDSPYMASEVALSPRPAVVSIRVRFGSKILNLPPQPKLNSPHIPDIDPAYILSDEFYYLYKGLEDGHVYLYGETGLGKTDGVYQLAARIQQPVREVNATGETSPEDFVGYLSAKDGSVYFREGVLLDCMKNGYWLLIDEIDYTSPKILSILNNVMQFGFVYVPELQERVYADKKFRIIGTANTNGTGDESGFYAGTNTMNRALLDRFDTAIEIEFPTEERLREIIRSRIGEFSTLEALSQFVYEVRRAIKTGQVFSPFGIRSTLKFARKLKKNEFDPWTCAALSFANMTDEVSRSVIKGLVSRVFGA